MRLTRWTAASRDCSAAAAINRSCSDSTAAPDWQVYCLEESEMNRLAIAGCCALSLSIGLPGFAAAQTEDHSQHMTPASSGVGTVSFETSCAPAVKDAFNPPEAELHSFWLPGARPGVAGVLTNDPPCGPTYRGRART